MEITGDAAFHADPMDSDDIAAQMTALVHLTEDERHERMEQLNQSIERFDLTRFRQGWRTAMADIVMRFLRPALRWPLALLLLVAGAPGPVHAQAMRLAVNTHFDQGWPIAAMGQVTTAGAQGIRDTIAWGKGRAGAGPLWLHRGQ